MSNSKEYKRITVKSLVEMKTVGEKISMLTAYDYTMAKIVDGAGIDVILVGDSASNVMAGHETTLPITLDQMIMLLQLFGELSDLLSWLICPLEHIKVTLKRHYDLQ